MSAPRAPSSLIALHPAPTPPPPPGWPAAAGLDGPAPAPPWSPADPHARLCLDLLLGRQLAWGDGAGASTRLCRPAASCGGCRTSKSEVLGLVLVGLRDQPEGRLEAGRRRRRAVAASSSTSASDSTWSSPSALRSRSAGTIATPWACRPPPWTWAPWTHSSASARVAEQPADRLGLPADGRQGAVQPVVVVPDQPVGALVDAAGPLLAVDDEHAAGADHQVIHVGGRPGHGQVVEDHVAVAGEPVQQPGGVPLPVGAALPGAGLLGGAKPQPPADQRRRPPGRPARPVAGRPGRRAPGRRRRRRRPAAPARPGCGSRPASSMARRRRYCDQGGAAGAAQAAGERPGRPAGVGPLGAAGGVRGTPRGWPGGSRAAQPLPSSWAGWPSWASRNRWSSSAVRARTDRPLPW